MTMEFLLAFLVIAPGALFACLASGWLLGWTPREKFIARLRAMGVGDGHQVVVYDAHGLMSAPRVWWTFRLMGKRDVAVLEGGLPK